MELVRRQLRRQPRVSRKITKRIPRIWVPQVRGQRCKIKTEGLRSLLTVTPPKNQAALARELSRGQTQYFGDELEPIVVAGMVHS